VTPAAGTGYPAASTAPVPGVDHSVRFLDGPSGALFCSVHSPAGRVKATLVMCPPLLADHPFSYRREVLLAVELARRGVAVWRFHYGGTGYSGGAPSEVSFESLAADARHVVHAASMAADCPVTVGGTRAGAMVAAAVAGDRPLLLWEPVAQGASYIREGFRARMVADGGQLKRTPPTSAELLAELRRAARVDLVGYSLHLRLHDSLAPRRLRDAAGSGPVLVIESRPTGLADDLRGSERDVTAATAGPAEAWWFHRTQQSDHAAVATQLAGVIDPWLRRAGAPVALTLPAGGAIAEPVFIQTGTGSVFGVLTPPEGAPRGEAVLLLWGGGGMPAFGRNQVATALARRLARRGYHVLQLDYPGRGDSPGSEPPDPIDEPAKQEVFTAARDAYRWLQSRGLSRVVTVGSCQGAVAALNTVDAAPELAGLALLAPPIAERFEAEGLDGGACGAVRALHPRMRDSFQQVVRDGTPMLIAFGTRDEGYRSFDAAMNGELGSMLHTAGDRLTLALTNERIHGYMTVSGQEATVEIVAGWVDRLGR
jgi:alpha-beta hydrolase superfamily lysophospholipase